MPLDILPNFREDLVFRDILKGLINIFETAFTNRIRAYYVLENSSDEQKNSANKVIFLILFKNGFQKNLEEQKKAWQLMHYCLMLTDKLTPLILSEEMCRQPSTDSASTSNHNRLVYGEDIQLDFLSGVGDKFFRLTDPTKTISLIKSTGNQTADNILGGTIGIFKTIFPGRLRASYLAGSYEYGHAAPMSDIDLSLFFKGGFKNTSENKLAICLTRWCSLLSKKIELEAVAWSESAWMHDQYDPVVIGPIKQASILLYGEDIRDKLPLPSIAQFTRQAMHLAYMFLARGRVQSFFNRNLPTKVLSYPLEYPDPEDEFYGYTWLQADTREGALINTTRDLVSTTTWLAITILALKADHYIVRKSACPQAYRDFINDEWTTLIEEIYEKCKIQWGYQIPNSPQERQLLKNYCKKVLAFENHFMLLYKEYIQSELKHENQNYKLYAIERLGHIVFWDENIVKTLQTFENCQDELLKRAAQQSLWIIQQVTKGNNPPLKSLKPTPPWTLKPSRWHQYVGTYIAGLQSLITVHIENEQLVGCLYIDDTGISFVCTPISNTHFVFENGQAQFLLAEDQSVTALKLEITGWQTIICQRVIEQSPEKESQVDAFLTQLRHLDIRIWTKDDQLCYDAPKGALTPNLRTELIRRKAEIIRFLDKAKSSIMKQSPLIEIQPGTSNPAFFCVYLDSTEFFSFVDLAHCLDHERPFYGLHSPKHLIERKPSPTLEEIATCYITAIRTVQENGPYFIGGLSLGGVIAFEMAQQLQRQGDTVALLALLDSYAPIFEKQLSLDDTTLLFGFIKSLEHSVGKKLDLPLDKFQEIESETQLNYILQQLKKENWVHNEQNLLQIKQLLQFYRIHIDAAQKYVPKVYPGQITLFQAEESPYTSPINGWRQFTSQDINHHIVPGNHYTMIKQPHVQTLVKYLHLYLKNP